MELCCVPKEKSNINVLKISKEFSNEKKIECIKGAIIKEKVPFTCDEEDLMVSSPVGNQIKYSKGIKADIVLSGYSTA